MLATATQTVLFWGPDLVALYNDAYAPTIGRKHPAALGRPAAESWTELWDDLEPLLRGTRETGETFTAKDRAFYIERDERGEHVNFDVSYSAVRGEDGSVAGVLCVVLETTDRVRTERRLRFLIELGNCLRPLSAPREIMAQAAGMLGRHLGVGRAGYGEVDAAAEVSTVEHEWTDGTMPSIAGRHRICDYGAVLASQVRAGRTIRFDDASAEPHLIDAQAAATFAAIGARAGISAPLVHDGRLVATLWVHHAAPRPWRDDEVTLVEDVARRAWEVVGRTRAEAALRDSERSLRVLMEGIPQLVWRSGNDGWWTWASPQWVAYTGLSDAQSRGHGWLDAVHPDEREAVAESWRQAGATGRFEADCRIRCSADGAWRWFQTRGAPVQGDGGRATEWLGTSTDIDDQMQAREVLARNGEYLGAKVAERTAELVAAEAALRQSQKMDAVGQLTGGIAHDFNNMLQGIDANLELMRRRVEQGRIADTARYIEAARRTVRRAAALTQRLLAFARQQALAPVTVHLDSLVRSMAEMVRRVVGPEVQVEVSLGDGAWPVLCDESQLENALLNLCVNARDAMPQGGWLTISTAEVQLSAAELAGDEGLVPGPYVMVSVADTGTGMDEATRARVFEPFFTTKPLGQGTGLGLSQVYGFVRQSGGLVRLDSAPGQGATVRILLPRQETAAQAGEDAKATSTVLLVEDDGDLRALVAEWLREEGLHVLEAADGAAALRLLHASSQVDVLVTDVGLPGGMNGRQVADAARAQRPAMPVLFVTGYAGDALQAVLPTGMDVLHKPFALDELGMRMQSMLAAVAGA